MLGISNLWDSVKPLWEALNSFLSVPAVQFFGPLLLAALALLIKPVREWATRWWKISWSWLRDSLLVGRIYPALGLATREELSEIQERIGHLQGSTPQHQGGLAGRTVERVKLKVTLGEQISTYLGKVQPTDVSDETINSLIQGPFCPKCNRNLLFELRLPGAIFPERKFWLKCRECGWSLPHGGDAKNFDADT